VYLSKTDESVPKHLSEVYLSKTDLVIVLPSTPSRLLISHLDVRSEADSRSSHASHTREMTSCCPCRRGQISITRWSSRSFKRLSAPRRACVDIITASLASRALFTATSLRISPARAITKMKRHEDAVDLQRLPDLSCSLSPDVVGAKNKIRQHPVDGQHLSYRPPCPLPNRFLARSSCVRVELTPRAFLLSCGLRRVSLQYFVGSGLRRIRTSSDPDFSGCMACMLGLLLFVHQELVSLYIVFMNRVRMWVPLGGGLRTLFQTSERERCRSAGRILSDCTKD
jgi:hypothetical protein